MGGFNDRDTRRMPGASGFDSDSLLTLLLLTLLLLTLLLLTLLLLTLLLLALLLLALLNSRLFRGEVVFLALNQIYYEVHWAVGCGVPGLPSELECKFAWLHILPVIH